MILLSKQFALFQSIIKFSPTHNFETDYNLVTILLIVRLWSIIFHLNAL